MNKGDLIKGKGNIDVGMPDKWRKEAKEMGIDPFWYAMDYRENPLGTPLNLLEIYVEKLEEANASLDAKLRELEKKNIVN
jgi:hypothetical protein